MTEPQVRRVAERSRYEIEVDGRRAGLAAYTERPGVVTFVHTEIDDALAARGLGGVLVRAALADVRRRGLTVRPACPFVRAWIAEHPDHLDLVAERDRARYSLP
ncbi:MAG: hypothetical protein AVDCRST_MAG66-4450 [uncultured Pseudonocardia sp.]|uniref:N-acetyltransferase domain-containing protein n=1 Tax=uncultured Pseudonocardia sp. TaxID=211455 RepID=A0A6J4QQD2_9PSEU|nr:MAG: hypothetical protein AVDCRST_MAG66-4450 [uncultured Pseudonocardia sp.]